MTLGILFPLHRKQSELVLRGELQLPHSARSSDTPEGRRIVGQIWLIPVWVIENVKRLKSDREQMTLLIRHREILMQRSIEVSESR